MNICKIISEELGLTESQVASCIALLDEGNSVPFISRYRKDVTHNMTDAQVRDTEARLDALRKLEQKKQSVYKLIDDQGKMTPEIAQALEECTKMTEVEDIYRPYKLKKETKYEKALQAKLDKLAEFIRTHRLEDKPKLFLERYSEEDLARLKQDLENEAQKYICENYPTIQDVIEGAKTVISYQVSDNPKHRENVKRNAHRNAVLKVTVNPNREDNIFDNYDNFQGLLFRIPSFRILAINRGCEKKCLKKEIILDDEKLLEDFCYFEKLKYCYYPDILKEAITTGYKKIMKPSLDTELFNEVFDKSEDFSIEKFKINLRELLLTSPVKNKVIMGIDPGLRTGCKYAVINPTGEVIGSGTLYLTHPGKAQNEAVEKLISAIEEYKVEVISLGNGTGGNETAKILDSKVIPHFNGKVRYVFVSESGASIYSASKLAEKEFGQYDVTIRGAISIARRLLDPLSELVKIPPESIGVGQYQHDLNKTKLKTSLGKVIEDIVNFVGVDVNSASSYILTYIAGLTNSIAQNICDYRNTHGKFKSREELKNVKGFGDRAFLNASGFLRIDGTNPLDNTGINPESYDVARRVLKYYNITDIKNAAETLSALQPKDIHLLLNTEDFSDVGESTLIDIINELIKPSTDPRSERVFPRLNPQVDDISKVKVNMVFEGVVRNLTDFGAFVDFGAHCEGLLHVSEISDQYVKNINDFLHIGQIVKVKVIDVKYDENAKEIKLTMKGVDKLPLTVDVQKKVNEEQQ